MTVSAPTRIAFAVSWLAALAIAGPARAADEYCPYGHATALLLVDRTTAFDATDRAVFLAATTEAVNHLGAGDRLVAYTMTGAFTESAKLFDGCKPACPDAGFFAGLMSACSPTVARARLRTFTTTLAEGLARMLRDPEQTAHSDLFRTVAEVSRALAADGGAGEGGGEGARPLRTVIVFSDLLENSTMVPERELRSLPPARIASRLREAGLVPLLAGAAVRVFGFGRDDAPGRPPLPQDQRRRIAETWSDWLRAGGAARVEIGFR